MKNTKTSHPSSRRSGRGVLQLSVGVYRSINEIEATIWDSVCAPFGFSATHRFIRTLEESQVVDAKYYYLLVWLDDEPVGAAALTGFRVSLDLLNSKLRKVIRLARMIWPRFLTLPILFCGTPISIGRHCLCSKYKNLDAAVIESIVNFMERTAALDSMAVLCAKEFPAGGLERFAHFAQRGFFCSPSIPRIRLGVRWSTFAEYLAEMRAGYRRQIISSLSKVRWTNLQPEFSDGNPNKQKGVYLEVRRPAPSQAPIFATLYAQTMSRVDSKLETLNEAFFQHLFDACGADLDLLLLKHSDAVLGAALLNCQNRTMHFLLVGVDYSTRDEYDTYFNLLNGIIALAIERSCDLVDLGQTTYHAKARFGGKPEEVNIYLKARRRSLHLLLKASRPLLFPAVGLRPLRVFRADTSTHQ